MNTSVAQFGFRFRSATGSTVHLMNQTMTQDEGIRKVAELIKGIKFAMMTTVSDDGKLYSRPMSTQEVEFDGDAWFFTADDSEKVRDLADKPQVNLAYSKSDSSAYKGWTIRIWR